ncbi:MAG: alpha/beta hydrolase [Pseudomonadota bacterium]
MPLADINGHAMYYEVHGNGPPALCMGGWGTYCHGGERHVGRVLLERYQVVIFDHRGLGESGDDLSVAPSMALYAEDAAGLLDHLGLTSAHVVGLVGMGACIGQELAINRPDLVRSMVNMNTWMKPDDLLRQQLEMFRDVHRDMGWAQFQKLVSIMSFEEHFYLANHHRLLGDNGPWRELNGRFPAHERLIQACLSHDTTDRLGQITCPALIIHCPLDIVNGPRLTVPLERAIPNAQGVTLEGAAHVIAGREMRTKYEAVLAAFFDELEGHA